MKILYIFPHPDDESYGPSRAISRQIREGHEVALLTLTRGGATKERHKFGYSIEEMGAVRYNELQCAAKSLGLSELTVQDFPDGGLKEMDPRILEAAIKTTIADYQPAIVVTYAVHGVSGHPDHIITHAVVKTAVMEMVAAGADYLRRLAFYTVTERKNPPKNWLKRSTFSKPEEIDCVVEAEDIDRENFLKALACYKTYQDRIEKSGIRKSKNKNVYFEIFQEDFEPPLSDLSAQLKDL